ncbi:MAG: fibrobacter succinogenes major paralogous domain-containing protein [Chitinispirillales bacterium]|nr:fibrobacter succinogenes major paralogous domain-containing protein [Chitinispirillales bacterium]
MNIKMALFRASVVFAVSASLPAVAWAADGGSFTDARDGKKYRTVKIGKQTWMAENLNYKTGVSWCYDGDESNCKEYGRLYDWGTAVKACPSGWRLPDTAGWNRLMAAVGGARKFNDDGEAYYDVAGKKLKSKTGWNDNDDGKSGNGADEFGFSALPGGGRLYTDNGTFFNAGYYGYWWSATEDESLAYTRSMLYDYLDDVYEGSGAKEEYGFSVRCVK